MSLDQLRSYYKLPGTAADRRMDEPVEVRYSVENLPDGEIVSHELGTCFVTRSVRGGDERHGPHQFAELTQSSASGLSALTGRDCAAISLADAVFLDTETTGLGMGAGTYVFLVGVGYFEGGRFHVNQFFLRGPHEEPAFLAVLRAFLQRFSLIVTFNGKAFDLPLLENRYVRQRQPLPLLDYAHADLLHPSRRLWKNRLASCALKDLETQVLGVERSEEDVPGWQIPEIYFRYLRSGQGDALKRVFYHNLYDILSLASLAVHLRTIIDEPFGGMIRHGKDFFALGGLLEKNGDLDRAALCYEEVLSRSGDMALRRDALWRLGRLHKRRADWVAACCAWLRLVEHGGDGALDALVEQAKYYEHVERNTARALDTVRQALTLADLPSRDDRQGYIGALEHRYARLIRRTYGSSRRATAR